MIKSHSGVDTQQVFRSRDGWEFNKNDLAWRLNKNTTVYLGWVDDLTVDIKSSFLTTLQFYSVHSSAAHARNISERAKYFFKFTGGELNTISLLAYRANLDDSKQHYLGGLKGFFVTWYEQGHPGISEEFFKTLKAWVLKGNEVGRAVLQMDSLKGPLTDIEMQGVLDGVIACYSKSRLLLEQFSLILTLVHTGRRSVQIVALKIKDLLLTEKNGISAYSINFPRAKQRHALWRSTFNTCAIDEDLWLILQLQAVDTVKRLQGLVNFSLSNSLIKEVPLFADFVNLSHGISEKNLLELLQFDYLHAPVKICNTALTRFSEIHCVFSERTGAPLSLSPRRFRSTLGTNVARQGYGVSIVAEVLDHSNVRSAGYYIKSLSDIVARIDKAVAQQLAPLAQAFQGVLVASEKEAVRGGDSSSRVSNGRVNVGTCGNYGFCGALAPIACYTCTHFQPWVDGPHEEVLNELLAGSDRVWGVTKDVKTALANDRLILAVTEVVQRCAQAKRATCDG
ncbi:site-specific integrase [Pseudomonas rhodesiae]|uniref:Phage integrase family protein n=1 Tax=Pseudomonas rhodesiae TaxID=76760 RepID=A0AAE8HIM8_9PSED|nr:site-specific integrase [Pseudomonas rhodesiae]TWR50695.1 phage integrase family protein [Pseudomonas rhodesiae]SDV16945.1 Phage integrase family protein [Pseudomonas rhodesiae]SDV17463.1 Phage integrase family protein [Pseudomonas rhodesiae]